MSPRRVNVDLPDEHVDAIDRVARGLSISRNRVLCAAVEEYLRSRCLIEPAPAAEPVAPAAERVSARAPSAAHPWRGRARANVRRDPSLRGKDGAPK